MSVVTLIDTAVFSEFLLMNLATLILLVHFIADRKKKLLHCSLASMKFYLQSGQRPYCLL